MRFFKKNQLKSVFGGDGEFSSTLDGSTFVGNCAVLCNSGAYIRSASNCNSSTQDAACRNQGGPSGACGGCTGC